LSREEKIKYYIGELRNQAAYIDSDLRGDLHDISTPTLILHGDADTQVPYDLGKELTLYIDGSEFVTIPDAGHGIMQWDQAISAIRKFCDGIAG
jgi:pimeloyl-ACP methyl ester carboxylesterase